MELDDQHAISLSGRDLMMLRTGLKAYLSVLAAHRKDDAGASNHEGEWIDVRNEVGRLIWRLEEAGAGPGSRVEHST